MSDLNVSPDVFSEEGSLYFKNKIAEKKRDILIFSDNELREEKEYLEFRKHQMTRLIETGGFSPAQKITYEIYLKDVEDLINAIDARLSRGGTRRKSIRRRKGRKSIRRIIKNRKSIKRRTRK
jgi:hypothetical protein